MTFTISLKEELSKLDDNMLEKRFSLNAFLILMGKFSNELEINSETASVIRKIYSDFKLIYDVNPRIKVRIQRRFRYKQAYMLNIIDKVDLIKESIKYKNIFEFCETNEDKVAFLKGAFLAVGSISDPKTSGYHLEFSCSKKKVSEDIRKLLMFFKLNAKVVKRSNKYITYLKSSEEISDLIKAFRAINSLFYFEDIRIYRDHKNMVNRLTNCEIANQEKTIKTGMKQLEAIEYLKENDLIDLLDDKTKTVVVMREKYPEASFSELAEIITLETNYKIGKSGINHNFIKINDIINKHKEVK